MLRRNPAFFVFIGCLACGGNVETTDASHAGAGGSGGSAATGGSAGIGGSAATGGSAGLGGSAATGGTGGTDGGAAGSGGSGLPCELSLVGQYAFDPADEEASFDGPVVVPTPSGFVLAFWQGKTSGDAQMARTKISDDGDAPSHHTSPTMPCVGGSTPRGLAASWNEQSHSGLMAFSVSPCSSADDPALYVDAFSGDGQSINEIKYDLPGSVRLSPVRAMAATPGSSWFLLAALYEDSPYRYEFDGLAVQSDPERIHADFFGATFASIAASATTVALLTDWPVNEMVVSLEEGSNTLNTYELAGGSRASIAAWGERAGLVVAAGANLAWTVLDESSVLATGAFAAGLSDSVDMTAWEDQLVIVEAAGGMIRLFQIAGIEGPAPFTTMSTPSLELAGAGSHVSVAAARDRVVVSWMRALEPIPAGVSPGGYAVLACDPGS